MVITEVFFTNRKENVDQSTQPKNQDVFVNQILSILPPTYAL
jgi:hypothetical protein